MSTPLTPCLFLSGPNVSVVRFHLLRVRVTLTDLETGHIPRRRPVLLLRRTDGTRDRPSMGVTPRPSSPKLQSACPSVGGVLARAGSPTPTTPYPDSPTLSGEGSFTRGLGPGPPPPRRVRHRGRKTETDRGIKKTTRIRQVGRSTPLERRGGPKQRQRGEGDRKGW